MRYVLSLAVLAGLVACPGGGNQTGKHVPIPPLPGNDVRLELPTIPAKIATVTSKPSDNNTSDKRSPLLDIMKAEGEREMGVLTKRPEPAYFLAYQLVEQRLVNLD